MTERSTVVIKLFNILITTIIIGPFTVTFWRGTWGLFDIYLFPHDIPLSAATSLGFGIAVQAIVCLLQNKLIEHTPNSNIACVIVTRLYIYVCSVASVSHWRGVWLMVDYYTGTHADSALWSIAIGFILLWQCRGLATTRAPPFVVITDTDASSFFTLETVFETKSGVRFFADVIFSIVYLHSSVVILWRGIWAFLDNEQVKPWLTLSIGYFLTYLVFITERIVVNLSKKARRQVILRDFVGNIYSILILSAAVCLWRGVWDLLDCHFLVTNPTGSNALSHAIGFVLLVAIKSSISIPVRGYHNDWTKDGEPNISVSITHLEMCCRNVRRPGRTPTTNTASTGEVTNDAPPLESANHL